MSYSSGYGPPLPQPHETSAVEIPHLLETLIDSPPQALDRLVHLRRHRADPPDCAPITDHLLVKIAVPVLTAVASPELSVHATLRSAGPAHSAGTRVDWPDPSRHATILREVLGASWCDEATILVPEGPPPADPWRWSLVAWLATMREDRASAPLLRFWAARVGDQGHRRLAYALSERSVEMVHDDRQYADYLTAAERLCAHLGLVWDAYGFGCRLARETNREPPPLPAVYSVPPERSPSISRSILDEATRELSRKVIDSADGRHRLERVAELWVVADEIDAERLRQELPPLIAGLVRCERPAVAAQVLDLARACAGPDAAVSELIEALAGLVRTDDRQARHLAAEHVLRAAEYRVGQGRADAALPLLWVATSLEATTSFQTTAGAAGFYRRASAVATAASAFELARTHANFAARA